MADIYTKTHPDCETSTHGTQRASDRGCVCPGAAIARRERLAHQARTSASRMSSTISPAINPDEADYVAVMRFMDGHVTWKQLQYEADRAAVVVQLARDLSVSTIASRLGASKQRIVNLLAQGRRVAA